MESREDWIESVEQGVLRELDLSRDVTDAQLYARIDEVIAKLCKDRHILLRDKVALRREVFYSMRGMDVLTPLLEDDTVTEIMVNGPESIYVERGGVLERTNLKFRSSDKFYTILQQITAQCNRTVNESSPIVDARLQDGSRVNIVLSPVSLDGAALTIRKFPKKPITMDDLVAWGSLPFEVAELLRLLVCSGYNILISGGTGSGKTTFLNALSQYIPPAQRVVTIEDSAELQLKNVSNKIRLEARNANVEGRNAITIRDLIRASLRMRPDRIIVGEVRGEEALDMLQALNTGHDGSISTGHANSARDMLSRLETMVLMGFSMPIPALRRQIASALELIIHLGRLRDHSRRVLEIVEVLGVVQGEIECRTWYTFEEQAQGCGTDAGRKAPLSGTRQRTAETRIDRVRGELVCCGSLQQVNKLKEAGCYEEFCSRVSSKEKMPTLAGRDDA